MTTIEWTRRPGTKGETWNPVRARDKATGKVGWFCEHVTEGCRFCYAEDMNGWRGNGLAYKAQNRGKLEIFLDEKTLQQPLHWRAPRTVFPCSMTDLFGDFVTDEMLNRIFAVMALTPQHTYLPLTKRPERMRDYLLDWMCREESRVADAAENLHPGPSVDIPDNIYDFPLGNVWLGVSCHDQASADQAVPPLLATPAARRFVSYEPALGPVDFSRMGLWLCQHWKHVDSQAKAPWCPEDPSKWWWKPQALRGPGQVMLDWIIAGGESGRGARPAHPDWFRSARDQCQAAGVPFFFKQWGAWAPDDEVDNRYVKRPVRSVRPVAGARSGEVGSAGWPPNAFMRKVGKKAAGRRLDGATYDAFPGPAP